MCLCLYDQFNGNTLSVSVSALSLSLVSLSLCFSFLPGRAVLCSGVLLHAALVGGRVVAGDGGQLGVVVAGLGPTGQIGPSSEATAGHGVESLRQVRCTLQHHLLRQPLRVSYKNHI